MNPKWLTDIDRQVIGMPFGDLDVHIHRHRSKTDIVVISKNSTIAPKTNEIAFSDLEKLINSLISAFFTGKLEFELDFKQGTIKLITIKNKEIKKYGSS